MTLPILVGLDGERRMGKSLGNYIGVGEPAREQFGKVLSIPDQLMTQWFTLLTDLPLDEITRLTDPAQTHPRQAKERLAREIVRFYHGDQAAQAASEDFLRQHRDKQDPNDMEERSLPAAEFANGPILVSKVLVALNMAKSNNNARQLIQQGGVSIGPSRARITEIAATVTVTAGLVVRVGRTVVRVQLT
jgi:tyrosyl-tRNA synthetase